MLTSSSLSFQYTTSVGSPFSCSHVTVAFLVSLLTGLRCFLHLFRHVFRHVFLQ